MLDNKNNLPARQLEVRLTVENTVKLDPQNPIPIQYGGELFYTPVASKRYLPFLGKKDNLPNLLLEARLTSTTQNACITSIAESIIGNGLMILDVEKPNDDFITWIKNVNNERQSFNEVLKQCGDGERTHGNQFLELVRGDVGGKKFLKVYLHSMLYCRLGEPDTDDIPNNVFISKLFARRGMSNKARDEAREVPLWNDNLLDKNKVWKKNEDGTESTMLHFKNEISGVDYYGMPASIAGLRYQVLEGKSAQYNIDNFENNMVLGGMLIFKSAMTQDEAQKNAKEILLSHVGEGKTGRIAVLSSESGLDDIDWKPYETQKDGSYIELDKRIEEKIIGANAWAKEFCFSDGGALGKGSGYLRSLWDLKEATLLKPLRKRLIDKVVFPIAQIYADWFSAKDIAGYAFDFKSSMPFSFMGDVDPETFMQVNEARKLGGLEVDESKKGVYLSEMTKQKNVQSQPTATQGATGA